MESLIVQKNILSKTRKIDLFGYNKYPVDFEWPAANDLKLDAKGAPLRVTSIQWSNSGSNYIASV